MRITKRIVLIPVLLLAVMLAGCDGKELKFERDAPAPTEPVPPVTVSPATNCAPTQVPGEIQITDQSRPSEVIDRVSGTLFNPTGASVCNWNISRVGNVSATDSCRNLSVSGTYSFQGFIHLNTGQEATPVEGSCNLPTSANSQLALSVLGINTPAMSNLMADRDATAGQLLGRP